MAARPVIGLMPAMLKYGTTYREQRKKIARAEHDHAYAAQMQLQSLQALVAKAHKGSPFYRELIDATFGSAFDPASLSLSDITRLPILDKAAIGAAGKRALAVPLNEVDWVETSGSNSEAPFGFYLDKGRSTREIAFVYDVWSRIGYSEGDARVCLRGFGLDPRGINLHDWDPALKELRLSVYPLTPHDASLFLDLIDARGVQYIYGYPSAIELFCRQMEVLGRTPKKPIKGLMPISEPTFAHQRRVISRVLGTPQFSCFYGLSEKVLFAAEVPGAQGTYEFNPLYGLAELVDAQGKPVTEIGQEGRVIGTGFLSTGMPMIRYDTGDIGRLVQLPTAENGQRMRVSDLSPRRKPDYLVARDGTRVVTTDMTPENQEFFAGIAEYQFFQDEPGEVEFRYVPAKDGTPSDAARLVKELDAICHNRLHFTARPVEKIYTGRSGKRAFIDQRLDFATY
jgi:phenylacetate-CoA ligase